MKTLGQIAWETAHEGYGVTWDEDHSPKGKEQWERIAAAVAAVVRTQCIEACERQVPVYGDIYDCVAAMRAAIRSMK